MMRRGHLLPAVLCACFIHLTVLPAKACSLALVLAMDASASVDRDEHSLQLNGLANALSDPEVVQAIEAVGGIWVTSFEWSGARQHLLQLGWRHLTDNASAKATSRLLRQAPRGYNEFPTAIGYALGFAATLMKTAPEPCARKVVDVAGDGENNDGFGPSSAYKAFDFADITVNGLVISDPNAPVIRFYREEVIRGPGAFIETAASYKDYQTAMKRKLIREIFGNGYALASQE